MAAATGHGTNSAQIRQHNQRVVLQRLRRLGAASKADLARAVGLTNVTVGQIIGDLAELGIVRTVGRLHTGERGQPAMMLRLDPSGACGIGVRLDRSRIETALVDLGGSVLAHRSHDLPLPPPDETLSLVCDDIEQLLAEAAPRDRRRVTGIGLARPFNLASWLRQLDTGAAAPPAGLPEWDATDFAASLARATGFTTFQENDGTAAAIAELLYGRGQEADSFLYLFIGPAIGGGVVLGGNYLRGVSDNAGDVAMMPVAPSTLPSAPRPGGGTDLLITRASLNALIRHLRFCGVAITGAAELPQAMAAHRGPVLEWIADCADALVGPIMAARALLDMPAVVIDSDMERSWTELLVQRLETALQAAVAEARTPPRLDIGRFGAMAGALGAASLPLFVHFGPPPGIPTGGDGRGTTGVDEHAAIA
jgi:predicted NBD/HSP70 family sugar kinase